MLDKPSGVSEKSLELFLKSYPEVSLEWLITGQGEMIAELSDNPLKVEEPRAIYGVDSREKEVGSRKPIPLIPADALAGWGQGEVSISEQDIQDRYVIPDFVDVDFMIRVKGSSMIPEYNSGDVVACRMIQERNFIQWNKTHVLSTRSQGVIIKRLRKGSKENRLLAVSVNADFEPFEIPEEDITNIALVVGVIRLE